VTVLTPGLPPDEVERLRWQAFGQKRPLALRSAEDLVRFTARRGFVLVSPVAGIHFPSALEAAAGRPLLENVRDERASQVEGWCVECVQAHTLLRAPLVERRDTLVAREWAADLAACGGAAAAALADGKKRTTGTAAGAASASGAADAAGAAGAADAARVRVADRVLRNVLVVTSEELAHLLDWQEPAAHAALTTLVERGDALVHPATRPRRATFQARECELLEGV
jgi:hypothetical protein